MKGMAWHQAWVTGPAPARARAAGGEGGMMATKNNPGQFDCYANAHPDEPMFVLLGRDRHAPLLVRLWALLRHRDGEDDAKVQEALRCAEAMDLHARSLGKDPDAIEVYGPLLIAATSGMADHPSDFGLACGCDECRSYP